MESDRYKIRGGGFHTQICVDLKEVRSIQRTSFWNKGWWYKCTFNNGTSVDIHVRETIDVLKLFEELNIELLEIHKHDGSSSDG